MRLGVRWRLTLAIVLITLAASTIVGIGLGRFTRSEFRQFLEVEEEVPVELPPVAALVERLAAADPAGARGELERMANVAGESRLLLFAPDGALVADTRPAGEVTLHEDGRLEVVGWREVDGERIEERLAMRGGIDLAEAGVSMGRLFVLPGARSEEREIDLSPAAGFTRSISRAHLLGIGIATGLALVIALVLSRRIVGPVETLTGASRLLAEGDLSQRVEVQSHDEIGELSDAFNVMAESLERQEVIRRNMVSDVAHELRTPLTHLRCKLESVQDGLVAPDEDLLSGLHREILHLGRLVDDLQELALAEAGQLPMSPVETDLMAVGREIVSNVGVAEDGSSVSIEESDGLPLAEVDVDRFRQVLRNLVENALRHGSGEGRVVVRLLREGTEGPDTGLIRCEVEDDGPGIEPEHLAHLFDRFYRTDPSRDRTTGGVGLGLAISQQLVRAWGGGIGVESEPGKGARFWFTVPTA